MPADVRLALMGGFVRFILEAAQQVFQSVIENREVHNADPSEREDQATSSTSNFSSFLSLKTTNWGLRWTTSPT